MNSGEGVGLLWDRQRAARELSISLRLLDSLTKEGVLPSIKLGHRRLYVPALVRATIHRLASMKVEAS